MRKCTRSTHWTQRSNSTYRAAFHRIKIPKKFILASDGEGEKHEFMVQVQFKDRSQVTFRVRLPKGPSPVDGQWDSTLLDPASPGARVEWPSQRW